MEASQLALSHCCRGAGLVSNALVVQPHQRVHSVQQPAGLALRACHGIHNRVSQSGGNVQSPVCSATTLLPKRSTAFSPPIALRHIGRCRGRHWLPESLVHLHASRIEARGVGSLPGAVDQDECEGCLPEDCNASQIKQRVLATVLAAALTLLAPSSSGAQVLPCEDVTSYYAPIAGLQGQVLKSVLHDVVKDAKSFSYVQVWDALKILDAADPTNPAASLDVVDIYSKRTLPKSSQGLPEGWNREHLWPRSYGLREGTPQFTDLHNLRPADTNVNSSRGNKPFGECSRDNDTTCLVPANREAGSDTATNRDIWTPPGEVRGDIARALLYMAVRYEGDPPGSKDLELSDKPSVELAQMGRLSTILKWHAADPPSPAERLRNDRVCSLYQHNRNPFVDRPELVAAIWGSGQTASPSPAAASSLEPPPQPAAPPKVRELSPGSAPALVPRGVPSGALSGAAWVNEFHYNNTGKDEGEFVEIAIGANVDPQTVVVHLYNGANNGVYRTLAVKNTGLFRKGEVTPDGATLYVCQLPQDGLQNGPADGIAVTIGDRVVDFISYEGTLTATSGPAAGLTSTSIVVREGDQTEKGSSVGLVDVLKHLWQVFKKATPGSQNRV